jgi:hypothetical protein
MRGKYIQGTLFCCKKCKATYMEKLKKACEDRKIELDNIYIDNIYIVDGISHVDEINSTVAHILASG